MDPEAFFREFRQAVSDERLDKYQQRGVEGGDANLVIHYAWNIALAESLYPPLQFLEVILRNSVHDALTSAYGTKAWWDSPGLLDGWSQRKVAGVREDIQRAGKAQTEGAIVAGLTFGFWTGLFHNRHRSKIWNKINRQVFPGLQKHERDRGKIQGLLNRLRIFRNRVFHHEPIWHLKSLRQHHRDIFYLVQIMRPGVLDCIKALDRFPELYGKGMATFQKDLEAKVPYLGVPAADP